MSSYSTSHLFHLDIEIENFDISSLPETDRRTVEADSYWATSHLLEGIQDNYTFAQPGIQYKVRTLEELVKRIDGRFTRVVALDPTLSHFRSTLSALEKSAHRISAICFPLDE